MDTNDCISRVLREQNEMKFFFKSHCEEIETKILLELEKYSFEPVRGIESPFVKNIKTFTKNQVQDELELEFLQGDDD